MIIISAVRLRHWTSWFVRFALIMALIYGLSAAFGWFERASHSATPEPVVIPTLFAQDWAGSPETRANMARSEGMGAYGYGAAQGTRG